MQKNNISISSDININLSKLKNLVLAPYTHIGGGANIVLYGKVCIKQGTIIGPNVTILTANHNYEGSKVPYDEVIIVKNVTIEENVWIGSNVIIVPGVTIGEGCVVAAGSCITKNIPPYSNSRRKSCSDIKNEKSRDI